MNTTPTKERRRHPRVHGSVPVKIFTDGVDAVTETMNLSRSGILCRMPRYVEPMTRLRIQMLLTIKKNARRVARKVCCSGVVVRTEPLAGEECRIAVFFNEISSRDAEAIDEFITASSS